jgi:uncharacterized protein YraI
MKPSVVRAFLALALSLPLAAAAQQLAHTAKTVNLRAGPDRMYPVVLVLPPGTQVILQGCLVDYRWCDVSFGYERGWVYAGNLRAISAQGYVPLVGVAPVLGITILQFGIHDYWGVHYRDRPWYRERRRWEQPTRPQVRPQPSAPLVRPPTDRAHPPGAGGQRPRHDEPRRIAPAR